MIQAITTLVGSIAGLLVYYDASKNKIGRVPGEKSFTNASAGMWSISSCILWFIVFPLYLLNRNQLLEKAKKQPQEPSSIRILILILYSAMLVYSFLNLSFLVADRPSMVTPTMSESHESPQAEMNRDLVSNDLTNLAFRAQQYFRRPQDLGGGGGSFATITIDKLTSKPANANGTYSVVDAQDKSITIIGIGVATGKDGNNPIKLIARVTEHDHKISIDN
jgi:hypothetical protein